MKFERLQAYSGIHTFLSIQDDFHGAGVWMVSILLQISSYFSSFFRFLEVVPCSQQQQQQQQLIIQKTSKRSEKK